MLRSTFLGYKTATSALRVNQNHLDIIGQNMSNVNNDVYTRQRLDTASVSLRTKNIKFALSGAVIGQGIKATGTSQYRDAYLDLRYRMQSAKAGDADIQYEALGDLEKVLDEVSTEKLEAQFSDLQEKLQNLTDYPSDSVMESTVRTSSSLLCQMFNDYSNQIQTVKDQYTDYLKDGAMTDVNKILKNIATLNKEIKEDNISGNPALELKDQRNAYLDELSSYLDIEVKLTPESIGAGKTVDVLSVNLRGSGTKLIDNDEYCQLEAVDSGNDIQVNMKKSIDASVPDGTDITGNITTGKISGYIKFLNGKGVYDTAGNTDIKGIQYYNAMLDTLAEKFASVMNDANTQPDGTLRPLFEARGGGTVDAGNIKISDAWANTSESYITNAQSSSTAGDNGGATDNILKMISLLKSGDGTFDFTTPSGAAVFKGTFQEFYTFNVTRVNLHVEDAKTSHETYSQTQYDIDYSRSSQSSVDLNEEGVNLLTYSKSYNAAAKLMTTLDDMLDTLINRMI